MIDTEFDLPEQSTPTDIASAKQADAASWVVAMSIGLQADAHRIFHALTVPEYLETWIEMPDRAADSSLVASRGANGYHLSHYRAGRTHVSIKSRFLSCHRRKMRLQWHKTHRLTCAESLVDIRLRGNFGSSILELRHTEFDSAEEFFWHQKLWQGSLEKLASLLRSA